MQKAIKQLVTYQIEALRYCETYRDAIAEAQGIDTGDYSHLFGDYEIVNIAFDLLGFAPTDREWLFDNPIFDPSVEPVSDDAIEQYVRWLIEQTLPGER